MTNLDNFYGHYILVISKTDHITELLERSINSEYMIRTPEHMRNRIIWFCSESLIQSDFTLDLKTTPGFDFSKDLVRKWFYINPDIPEPESKPARIITDIYDPALYEHVCKIKTRISDVFLFSQNEEEDNLLPLIVGMIKSPDHMPDIHITAECFSFASIKILYESGVNEIFNAKKFLHRLVLTSIVNSTFTEFIHEMMFNRSLNSKTTNDLNLANSSYSIINVIPPPDRCFDIHDNNSSDFHKLCQDHSIIPISAYVSLEGHFILVPVGLNSAFRLSKGDSLIVIAKSFSNLRSFESELRKNDQLISIIHKNVS